MPKTQSPLWPEPNLLAPLLAMKSRRTRKLIYLDQNVLSQMAKIPEGRVPEHYTVLLKCLREAAIAGKAICPYSFSRRTESAEVARLWPAIHTIMSDLCFDVRFKLWREIILGEIAIGIDAARSVLSGSNNLPEISWSTYFDADPSKEHDDRYFDFRGTLIRVQATTPIAEHECQRAARIRADYEARIKVARERDRSLGLRGRPLLDYLVHAFHSAIRSDPTLNPYERKILDDAMSLERDPAAEGVAALFRFVPQLWISQRYEGKLLEQGGRRLGSGDFLDTESLALALTTCDFIVTERCMAELARQLNFDSKFQCAFISIDAVSINRFSAQIDAIA